MWLVPLLGQAISIAMIIMGSLCVNDTDHHPAYCPYIGFDGAICFIVFGSIGICCCGQQSRKKEPEPKQNVLLDPSNTV